MMRASILPRNRLPLLSLALALLALAAFFAHDAPPAAQASSHVYVSNLGETTDTNVTTITGTQAQGFRTGTNTSGYTLGSIDAVLENTNMTSDQRDTIRAELWSTATSGDNDGDPDSKIADLTVPAHPITAGTVSFAAPVGTTLTASTTYHVAFYTVGNFALQLDITASSDEDSGAAAGWSISNVRKFVADDVPTSSSSWSDATDSNIRISVNAPEAGPTDLSDLTAEGSTDGSTFAALTGANALAPAFDAATTGYRATVGNDITHVRLTPTVAVDGSTVKVGKSGTTLTTVTSGSASGAISLDVGDNQITVEVTAADTTTQDYTVTVRRVPSGTEWHATLVPRDLGSVWGVGCLTGSSVSNNRCSTSTTLTDHDFSVGGTDYTTAAVGVIGTSFYFTPSPEPNAEFKALNFCVGETQFSLSSATAGVNTWTNAGLSWTAGVPVSLSVGTSCAQQTTSSNADLSALTAEGSTDGSSFSALTGADSMVPAFDAATTSYRATVGNSTTHVKLTPTVDDSGATVKVGLAGSTLNPVTSGSASAAIELAEGDNQITVEVTASDTTTTQNYTVTVWRVTSGTEWHATLTPQTYSTGNTASDGHGCQAEVDCDSQLTSQTAEFTVGGTAFGLESIMDLDAGILTVGFTATPNSALQALKFCIGATAYTIVSGGVQQTVDAGLAGGVPVSLSVGTSCAQQTTSSNANLSNLTASSSASSTGTFSPVTLSPPTFSATTTSYTATVPNDQTHAKLTPTVDDTGKATVTVDGTEVIDTQASGAISLTVGPNAITVRVTAEDGTTKDYTVTITREAQTTTPTPTTGVTLVSNIGQTAESGSRTTSNVIQAQGFTTGSNADGYTLGSIEASIRGEPTSAQRDTIRAQLWSWTNTGPDAKVADLTVPDHPIAAGTVKFTDPAGTNLAASTSYFLVLYTTGTFNLEVTSTTSDDEDAGGQAGWNVFNLFHNSAGAQTPSGSTTWTRQDSTNAALRIRVNGELAVAPPSDNANLVFLTASSSDNAGRVFNDLTLSPAFDKARTGYTATVAHDQGYAKLTPWVEEPGQARVAWRKGNTGSFTPVAYARSTAAIALDVEANAITVRVTAEDGTTKDYTVTITRQGPAVSLSASPNPVAEGSSVTITATLSAALAGSVEIPLAITDNSAESGDHGSLASITIGSGATTGNGTITTAQDSDSDHETFTVSLGILPATVVAGSPSSVLVAIQDDEAATPLPAYALEVAWSGTLTVADQGVVGLGCVELFPCSASRLSPNEFTHNGTTYQINRVLLDSGILSLATSPALPRDWALVVGGSWLHVSDETRHVQDRKIVRWPVTNISWTEGSTVTLALVAPRTSVPTVSLSATPNPVLEGNTVTVTATLSSPLTSSVAIPVSISLAGAPSSITINAGSTTGTASVATAQDANTCTARGLAAAEACEDETFRVELGRQLPTAVRSGHPKQLIVNVIDDDVALPTVWMWVSAGSSVTEGEDATVRVELSRLVRADVRIPLTYAGESDGGNLNPAEPADYSGPSEVIIPGSRGTGSSAIRIPEDGDDDELEAFTVSLGALPTWLRAGSPSSARVNIQDGNPADPNCDGCGTGAGVGQSGAPPENRAPTVSNALADVAFVNETSAQLAPLAGVFDDADGDALTVSAASSDEAVATVEVEPGYSALTVTARARGTATITVTADDGNGGTVDDEFTVTVKAAPVVASGLSDISDLVLWDTRDISLSGVFSDPDGDALTFSAAVSDDLVVFVGVLHDLMSLYGTDLGTATITVTAEDSDGNTVSDTFDVEVVKKYADLIAKMKEYRNDPCCEGDQAHTRRWDRALLAFGETVADQTLTAMSASEAQGYADQGWTRWVEVARALKEIEGSGQGTPNRAPTVSSAIPDATIVNESGTSQVSLSGVFSDADNDSLTITAASSNTARATVAVASDGSSLTVSAQARGTATITVTADDGNGATVDDTFTVTVKAAPTVSAALSDVSNLEVDGSQDISLSGVFSDADGDSLTITATSSDETKATVTVASDGSKLTLTGVAVGTAAITVTALDSDGNTVSDRFDALVAKKYAGLIAQMYEWRNDPQWKEYKEHTDRWDRALLAFGETVADQTLTAMTADEAQGYADRGWERWEPVTAALRELEGG